MSQEALAGRTGFYPSYVGHVERARRNISIKNLFRIAQGLGVDPRELLTPPSEKGTLSGFKAGFAPERILAFNLRRLRNAAGISQEVLSGRCGFSRTYVGYVERDLSNIPIKNLFRIAQGLGVDPRELLTPPPEEES